MKPFRNLASRLEAQRLIEENVTRTGRTEEVCLEEAAGRVLAADVVAGFNVPPFDRASMDGYAVRAADTYGASAVRPRRLRLVGARHAGEPYDGTVGEGECVEIATGSPLPGGSDAVVMVEYTRLEGGYVEVQEPAHPGSNVAPEGEDIREGEVVVRAGGLITPGRLGVAAALGYTSVTVYAKPRVAVYSTGAEIAPQGAPLKPGQIYDINSFTLSSVIEANSCTAVRRGVVGDDRRALEAALGEAPDYDLVVFSGGSSVGSRDMLGEVVESMGRVLFHGVQVKPGKPTLFGLVGGTPVFGMPGYPTSCLSNAYVFLAPALRKVAGLPPAEPRTVRARLGGKMIASSGREQFLTVRLEEGVAVPVFKQSGDITSMAHADGYIILPINADVLEEGAEVTVTLLG
jgi:molybdenum cofactor synthesis domain-containing protein